MIKKLIQFFDDRAKMHAEITSLVVKLRERERAQEDLQKENAELKQWLEVQEQKYRALSLKYDTLGQIKENYMQASRAIDAVKSLQKAVGELAQFSKLSV